MRSPLNKSLEKLNESVERLEKTLSQKTVSNNEVFVFSEDRTPSIPLTTPASSKTTAKIEQRLDSVIDLLESVLANG